MSGIEFGHAGRALNAAARELGWRTVGWRHPPRVPGAHRTIRTGADGESVIAVDLRRGEQAVKADMIAGLCRANRKPDDAGAGYAETLNRYLNPDRRGTVDPERSIQKV